MLDWIITMKHLFWASALVSSLFVSAASAAQPTFFSNLAGSWSGSGTAYLARTGEISADCKLKIAGGENKVSMQGTCGRFIFHQNLGFTLVKAGGNKYAGVYTGSKTGPARLQGTLQGDQLRLTITWGGLVNGDRTANMILRRTGPNSFAQTVIDQVAGRSRDTSQFNFTRSQSVAQQATDD
jgi:hypothetical protein